MSGYGQLTPFQCWKTSKGDTAEFNRLMFQYGHIQRRAKTPTPHKFVGQKQRIACGACNGHYDAPWHTH